MKYLFAAILLYCPITLAAQDEKPAQLKKLELAFRYLSSLYVDQVDAEPLVEEAIRAMIGELDPHSAYLTADEMKGVKESFDGEFSGIGVEFNVVKDTVIVVNTIAGGPAERVGVQPNDRIVRIDTLSAIGLKRADVPKYLRGKSGSKVDIEVVRRGSPATLSFTIVRDKIPINTIDAAYRIDDKYGYIKVNRFGRTTMDEFYKAYRSLGKIDGLILDLCGNGGGLLEQAIEMANFFLPKGAAILSIEGRAVPSTSFNALFNGEYMNGPLVVMIDENSASASEIVAGAVQDWDRGVIVGRPSFGKGLVQRQVSLPDGSAMRITRARYHTPTGRAIQRPYKRGKSKEYYMDHYKRFGGNVDSISMSAQSYKTLLTGRRVYGGGGITPDIVTPIDTTGYTPYLMELVRRGVINEFTINYLDKSRKQLLTSYPTIDLFAEKFEPSQALFDELKEFASNSGVEFKEGQFSTSKPILRTQIRALIAQKLYGQEFIYRIINGSGNVMYNKAVEVLDNWSKLGSKLLEVKK